jgi:DUF971 family protein
MPVPPDPRKKASSVKIHVSSGAGVDIAWSDGHASHYEFAYLREQCPCATCDEDRRKKETLAARGRSSAWVLPMYKPRTSARSARAIGSYAIQITFTDGHSTGIYSFDYLRTVCPCEDCGRAFRSSGN